MKVKMFPDSSAIDFAKIDKNDLTIRFTNGSTYLYPGVKQEHIDGLLNAESAGGYLYRNIRSNYDAIKVSPTGAFS